VLDAFCGVGGNAIAFAQTCERGASHQTALFSNLSNLSCIYFRTDSLFSTKCNAIAHQVIALDNSETRLKLARHNAHIYGVADRIEFVLADYPSFVRAQLALPQAARRPIDVVFLSPPWGGPGYLYDAPAAAAAAAADEVAQPAECAEYRLSAVLPIPGYDLWHMTRRITKNVAFFLPRNVCIEDVAKLTDVPEQSTTVLETENEEGRGQEMIEIEEEWMGTKLKAVTCYFGGLVAGQEDLFDVC
jgi:trimethylguanosine synthase